MIVGLEIGCRLTRAVAIFVWAFILSDACALRGIGLRKGSNEIDSIRDEAKFQV